jgi:hypothetical protein
METAIRLVTDKDTIEHYLEMTNQAFKGTIPAAIQFSETIITIAGSLDKLTSAMQSYYDDFFNDTEKQAMLKTQLTEAMSQYGMALPDTRAGYRTLVESQDLTTATGAADYTELMLLAKTADQYYKYVEAANAAIVPANYSTNQAYQEALAGISQYAEGGIASGPESGYSATLHGTELVISPKKSYSATVKSGLNSEEIVSAIEKLREDIGHHALYSKANSDRIKRILDQWEGIGLPTTRIQ